MGSYGIGVSRLVGAIIESKYDQKDEYYEMAIDHISFWNCGNNSNV